MRTLLHFAVLATVTLAVTFTLPLAAQADALPRGVLPVLQANGHAYVALRATPSESWGRGGVRLVQREDPTVAVRNVRLSALPRDVREDARGTIRVHNQGGEVCRARMARPVLLRRATPMEYEPWNGAYGDPRLSDREVARTVWDSFGLESLLVARLIPVAGRCRTGSWASRTALTFGTRSTDVPEPLLNAFRATEGHRSRAEVWGEVREQEGDPAEHWDARMHGDRGMSSLRIGTREFRLVSASAYGGCGDFTGSAWGLFELTDDGPIVVSHGSDYDDPPYTLADLDGDGVPEVIGYARVRLSTTGQRVDVSAPFFGCPC